MPTTTGKTTGKPTSKTGKSSAGKARSRTSSTSSASSASAKSKNGPVTRGTASLVIVESPAKARTIKKYLGRNFNVEASMGHVRDLPKSTLGVDVEHNFTPQYVVPRDKNKTVKDLRQHVQSARAVYLATDPDREGEAIAWHVREVTGAGQRGQPVFRVEFHEITPGAIQDAVAHPRDIDMHMVDAQ